MIRFRVRLNWYLGPAISTREELEAEGVSREIVVRWVLIERAPPVPAREEIAERPYTSKRRRGEEVNKHSLKPTEAPGQQHGPAAGVLGDVGEGEVLVFPIFQILP